MKDDAVLLDTASVLFGLRGSLIKEADGMTYSIDRRDVGAVQVHDAIFGIYGAVTNLRSMLASTLSEKRKERLRDAVRDLEGSVEELEEVLRGEFSRKATVRRRLQAFRKEAAP